MLIIKAPTLDPDSLALRPEAEKIRAGQRILTDLKVTIKGPSHDPGGTGVQTRNPKSSNLNPKS